MRTTLNMAAILAAGLFFLMLSSCVTYIRPVSAAQLVPDQGYIALRMHDRTLALGETESGYQIRISHLDSDEDYILYYGDREELIILALPEGAYEIISISRLIPSANGESESKNRIQIPDELSRNFSVSAGNITYLGDSWVESFNLSIISFGKKFQAGRDFPRAREELNARYANFSEFVLTDG